MLDLHCHLLPGVDDGPRDLEGALALARTLREVGFSVVAASPHSGGGPGGDVRPERAEVARRELGRALREAGVDLALLPNAEHVITPEFLTRLAAGEVVPIGGNTRWLLVELPWGGMADIPGALFRLQTRGWKLLLAHPERHEYLDVPAVEQLVARGVKTQLELGSFAGVLGSRAESFARELANRSLGHVLATDLHSPQDARAWLSEAIERVETMLGKRALTRGVTENPKAILADAALETVTPLVEAR